MASVNRNTLAHNKVSKNLVNIYNSQIPTQFFAKEAKVTADHTWQEQKGKYDENMKKRENREMTLF